MEEVQTALVFFSCIQGSILEDPTKIPKVHHAFEKLIHSCLQRCSFVLGKEPNRILLDYEQICQGYIFSLLWGLQYILYQNHQILNRLQADFVVVSFCFVFRK